MTEQKLEHNTIKERAKKKLERDMGPANSWQVQAAPEGGLRWHSSAGMLEREPARQLWQRVENLLFKLRPASYY